MGSQFSGFGKRRPGSALWRACGGLVVVALAVGLAACGSSSSSSGGVSSKPTSLAALPKTGCGSAPALKTDDPDGVLATLPAQYQKAFAGFPEVRKSNWINFKPKHAPPYNVAIVSPPPTSDLLAKIVSVMQQRLKQDPSIGSVRTLTTTDVDAGQQLRALSNALLRKPDLVIMVPVQPGALVAPIARAAKMGIPVETVMGPVYASPNAINVGLNDPKVAGQVAGRMVQSLGGKGNIVLSHGYPGTDPDTQRMDAIKAAVAKCPGMKIGGEIYGLFTTGPTKSEMLKYLATHPAPVNGVFTSGSMGVGVISAFQQSGRPVPFTTTLGILKGEAGYWRQNQGKFHSAGSIQAGTPFGTAGALVALKTLAGQGPKINAFTNDQQLVTDENLDDHSDPSWTLKTPSFVDAPADSLMSDEYISGLFKNGQPTK